MKEAVSHRNAFAAAHSAYAMSLKNTGLALSDYAQGEVQNPNLLPSSTVSQTPVETLPPPPPPFNLAQSPLQRASSMPELPISKNDPIPSHPVIEEGIEESEEEDAIQSKTGNLRQRGRRRPSSKEVPPIEDGNLPRPPSPPRTPPLTRAPPPPPPPESKDSAWDFIFHVENMPGPSLGEEGGDVNKVENEQEVFGVKSTRGDPEVDLLRSENVDPEVPEKMVEPSPMAVNAMRKVKQRGSVATVKSIVTFDLFRIFRELDDQFLKASESAHEVSKMLEANRLHYHSNFADNRGHIDHSARVMRVITWNRSFRGLSNIDDTKDDFDSDENETHATVLDKLLAWEKKLYDEVKAGEIMKFEYQRKVASLNKKKERGSNSEALEKTKAAVSHLHTRYIVDMQSLDSTVSEINRLRDQELYPKLRELVDGLATMWDAMRIHHLNQSKIVMALKSLDISQSPKETSDQHHERTKQLSIVIQTWHSHFQDLVRYQKSYIDALRNWLKLNLVPIESSLKEKVSSPPRAQNPPIQMLLWAWHEYLEKLPEEVAKSAIYNFAAVINSIVQHQEDEIKLKQKCEETRKELSRKTRQFEDWYNKFMQKIAHDEVDADGTDAGAHKDAIAERQFVLVALRKRLEEEEEEYQRQCVSVREKSLMTLKSRLPEIFRAMSEFALASSETYRNLRAISLRSHNTGGSSS